jgi:hypothetical protein
VIGGVNKERQTLRSGARVVKLKMKYFFLDSRVTGELGAGKIIYG